MTAKIGMLHPGAMGSSVGASARAAGADVCWASDRRSEATAARARDAGLRDVGTLPALVAEAEVILSVCPPAEAAAVARSVFALGFSGTYVDANALSPAAVREIAALAEATGCAFVDGGIVGPPARAPGTTVLYLAGSGVDDVASLFRGSPLEATALPGEVGAASALKMAYAAYTKGSSALLLAVRALARAEDVEVPLLAHWERTHPQLEQVSEGTARATAPKAWRFAPEMREIAATFAAAGLPRGFHDAAADLYASLESFKDDPDATLDEVLAQLLKPSGVAEP
jgi:3-hydroxyisobutyrate dehydrogenase-like beta-hydroxyacid dehydrogenase